MSICPTCVPAGAQTPKVVVLRGSTQSVAKCLQQLPRFTPLPLGKTTDPSQAVHALLQRGMSPVVEIPSSVDGGRSILSALHGSGLPLTTVLIHEPLEAQLRNLGPSESVLAVFSYCAHWRGSPQRTAHSVAYLTPQSLQKALALVQSKLKAIGTATEDSVVQHRLLTMFAAPLLGIGPHSGSWLEPRHTAANHDQIVISGKDAVKSADFILSHRAVVSKSAAAAWPTFSALQPCRDCSRSGRRSPADQPLCGPCLRATADSLREPSLWPVLRGSSYQATLLGKVQDAFLALFGFAANWLTTPPPEISTLATAGQFYAFGFSRERGCCLIDEDPATSDFVANCNSVPDGEHWTDPTPIKLLKENDFLAQPEEVWKDDPISLFHDGQGPWAVLLTDVVQGDADDCWLLAALINATNINAVNQIFAYYDEKKGVFQVRLFSCDSDDSIFDKPAYICVDRRVVCRKNVITGETYLPYAHSSTKGEIWPCLVQKAFAKACSRGEGSKKKTGFPAMQWGYGAIGNAILLGGRATTLARKTYLDTQDTNYSDLNARALFTDWNTLIRRGCSLDAAWTEKKPDESSGTERHSGNNGLKARHEYAVLGVMEVPLRTGSSETVLLAKFQNPLGGFASSEAEACGNNQRDWRGNWSDCSALWQTYPDVASAVGWKPNTAATKGVFFMSFEDICEQLASYQLWEPMRDFPTPTPNPENTPTPLPTSGPDPTSAPAPATPLTRNAPNPQFQATFRGKGGWFNLDNICAEVYCLQPPCGPDSEARAAAQEVAQGLGKPWLGEGEGEQIQARCTDEGQGFELDDLVSSQPAPSRSQYRVDFYD
eukprot:TRINITY_DN4538_c0_g1_i1.p1 TRINITY_DN4538_c0_g1~~TRINITY_DN4538_c0_g1_i1.p1  ORF type:complete len:829 (+),score=75.12 TRINITY_DN4538_c0_g1_i1:1912-4398(+)